MVRKRPIGRQTHSIADLRTMDSDLSSQDPIQVIQDQANGGIIKEPTSPRLPRVKSHESVLDTSRSRAVSAEGDQLEKLLSQVQTLVHNISVTHLDQVDHKLADTSKIIESHFDDILLNLRNTKDYMSEWISNEARDIAVRAGFSFRFFSKEYMIRLFVAITVFLISAYICSLASVCAGFRTPNIQILDLDGNVNEGNKSLPDLGHDLWAYLLEYFKYVPYS